MTEPIKSGDRAEVEIIDSGVGISEAEHARIFDAFYQVDGGSTREHGGTGLGLALSRGLAEVMHGSLVVKSELGHGARFTLTIPLISA